MESMQTSNYQHLQINIHCEMFKRIVYILVVYCLAQWMNEIPCARYAAARLLRPSHNIYLCAGIQRERAG